MDNGSWTSSAGIRPPRKSIRIRPFRVACMLAGAAMLHWNPSHAQPAIAESAHFARANGDIHLDGRPDESSWHTAIPITRFFETNPQSLTAPSLRTEARFLYDDEYVYVAISAFESQPASIRSGYVRRDSVDVEQDYVEVLLDPMNTRRTAFMFRANASGIATDGLYSEEQHSRDLRPDFNFDVRTAGDRGAWHAEFRIPLATLRHRVGPDQSWGYVVYRNRPRGTTVTIASIPEPRSATCILCFAGELSGISIGSSLAPIYLTPHVTYSHTDATERIVGGVDAKWMLRPDTALDVTLAPDFSQIEADDLQLTANAPFTLALKEKRPFFLEGTDLFTTPISAIYTRSFSDPDAGLRITHRGTNSAYSVLLLRDAGKGITIEPGRSRSVAVPDAPASSAIVARYTQQLGDTTVGALVTARINDGPQGESYTYGVDGAWAPNTTNRLSAQVLGSSTLNPDRVDLLHSWDGRRLDGSAYAVAWQHASDHWYANILKSGYSNGFRAWNGFVPQVGIEATSAVAGLLFYPQNSFLLNVVPNLLYDAVNSDSGQEISSDFAPRLTFSMSHGTDLTLGWHPHATNTTAVGTRSYRYASLALTTTPVAWMRGASITAQYGDGLNFSTGEINRAAGAMIEAPLRFGDRVEVTVSLAYESQRPRSGAGNASAFTERNTQFNLLYHFSSRMYLQALHQNSSFSANQQPDGRDLGSRETTTSALLSYQANWQTRYYIGFRRTATTISDSTGDSEVFAKVSYVLSW